MPFDMQARVTAVERCGPYVRTSFEAPDIAREAEPGQFAMLRVSGSSSSDPLLRRPLSIHDRTGSGVEFFFSIAGRGTELLAAKEPGDAVDILGPLGRGFPLDKDMAGRIAFCVGGGRGIAPLFFLAGELRARGAEVRILYGGRSAADVPLREKFEAAGFRTFVSTDDGSFGFPGLVTHLYEQRAADERPGVLYACGPDAMMQVLAESAARIGVPAWFSLESVMGCGFGACWGCVHRIRRDSGPEWVKICEEGPVFPGEEIVWETGP